MLAKWSSWGALPEIFDEDRDDWSRERDQLRALLDPAAYAAARRTTINAHYTDPAYVREVWAALERLGFDGGEVLEPGSGAGTFIGLAPSTAAMTGVELDPTTAAIAAALYPHARVRAESFADSRFRRGQFDAAVGNVPFANVTLHDPTFNAGGHSIHNHFIIKSLQLTRPGGLVAVLTSHYTMDAQNPAARREMARYADLVGAVRLPTGAHRRSAGTEAVTDLLIFRRHDPGQPRDFAPWDTVVPQIIDGEKVTINTLFVARPDLVLGELHVGTGMYNGAQLQVRAELHETPTRLAAALQKITAEAAERGIRMSPRSAELEAARAAFTEADPTLWEGTIVSQAGDTFSVVQEGGYAPFAVPKTNARELRELIGLRDAAIALLKAEEATLEDSAEIAVARADLRDRYARYKLGYGPINRYTLRPTGRVDPATGEARMARITPRAVALMKQDPFGPFVLALERFDDETQTATSAAILTQRVVLPRPVVEGAETPSEAIAISLDRTGGVDLPTIAHLLGVDEDSARAALGELVYDEPGSGRIIHAPEYLSGNVRVKLDAARAAVVDDSRFAVNVAALERALPSTLTSEDIVAKLGAAWIDPATHRQFLAELLADSSIQVENPLPGQWEVRGNRYGVRATSEWGTLRRPATDIAQAVMEQRPLTVYDEIDDGITKRRVLNAIETTAAQEKAQLLSERFAEWVWEEPERAIRLETEYNRRFNSYVLRDYTGAGDYLTLPGMAASFVPRPHQRDVVARAIAEPAVGLFHEVGAGKTAEMVMLTAELKRMGLVSKPTIVIPNHMIEQFSREYLQIYPQARVLAVSTDDLAGDKRRLFVARAAANDWDAIIMTRSAFERIPLSGDAQAAYVDAQIAELRVALENAKGEHAMSTKRIERAVLAAENRQKKLLDKQRDTGLTFEATGIDYVVVDELHGYKNLATESNIPDANIAGSQRASDLHMKVEYLRSKHGIRVFTGATATPIANSITEAYVMQRYMRPDMLKEAGLEAFDAWAATFGETVTEMEMSPAGEGTFRLKTRFARFQNVPEMLRMWHVFADVKTAEDLKLPVPLVAKRPDGKRLPQTVVLQPTAELEAYIRRLGERADAIAQRRVTPDEDNMLLVSTDGRKAALDMRLIDPWSEPTGMVKLDAPAAEIHRLWEATRDLRYTDSVTGEESPVPGALQLVFCDLGTPSSNWNAYDELKLKLVERGMDPARVRFIHDARNDTERARLFAAARAGHVSVLIGSTEKMGVGTNVQDRIVALHHIDCPWRPADLEQRDGRGIRQNNQNAEVWKFRYVVERSFDAYQWQTVERKARFIAQLMRGSLDSREVEDIGDTAMSAAEAKAISSGNPLLLEKANADNALARLQRLERAYHRNLANLGFARTTATQRVQLLETQIAQLKAAAPRAVDTTADAFKMRVGDEEFTSRTEAGHAIAAWAASSDLRWASRYSVRDYGVIGSIGGFDVRLSTQLPLGGDEVLVSVRLEELPRMGLSYPKSHFLEGGVGIVRSLENRVAAIASTLDDLAADKASTERELDELDARLHVPFAHADALAAAEQLAAEVDRRLAEQQAKPPATASVPEAAATAAAVAGLGFATPPGNADGIRPASHDRPPAERVDTRDADLSR